MPVLCVVLFFTSCKPKVKLSNGQVTYFKQDTMKVMIDGDEETYITEGAQFVGGMPMVKDSVEVMHIKKNAQLVRLIPPKGRIIDTHIDKSKPVLTTPAPKGTREKADAFVKMMSKKNKH